MKGKLALAAVAIAIAAFFLVRQRSSSSEPAKPAQTILTAPKKPAEPPTGHNRHRTPMPEKPALDQKWLEDQYRTAAESGDPRPGHAAFRASTDAFFDYNLEFAKAKVEAEGLSMDEVKELTYFGFLVMQSQQFGEVEEILGRDLAEPEKQALDDLKNTANQAFTEEMRAMVKDGASEQERQAFIEKTEADYMKRYYELSGMTETQFDDLLAGDISRMYAPISTPPPEQPPPPRDYVEPQTRPGEEPR